MSSKITNRTVILALAITFAMSLFWGDNVEAAPYIITVDTFDLMKKKAEEKKGDEEAKTLFKLIDGKRAHATQLCYDDADTVHGVYWVKNNDTTSFVILPAKQETTITTYYHTVKYSPIAAEVAILINKYPADRRLKKIAILLREAIDSNERGDFDSFRMKMSQSVAQLEEYKSQKGISIPDFHIGGDTHKIYLPPYKKR